MEESTSFQSGGGTRNPELEPGSLERVLEDGTSKLTAARQRGQSAGVVVDGGFLAYALREAHKDAFLALCRTASAVVCCRVTPMQKAIVTNLVKERAKAVTLAIGDGANDVGMIRAAHIGCGISGREGRAAVLAADYSFARFRHLKRLLLLHGRWSYLRNSEVVLYAFYKNAAYCLPNVILAFLSGFSSQPIYTSSLIASYNLFWTSLPTIVYAVFEQDLTPATVFANPRVYSVTMHERWTGFFMRLAGWMMSGVVQSLLMFWANALTFSSSSADGSMHGIVALGTALYTSVIVVVNLKVALRTSHWTWVMVVVLFGISIGIWFPFVAVVSKLDKLFSNMIGVSGALFTDARFWVGSVVGVPMLALTPDFVAANVRWWLRPTDAQILHEVEANAKRDAARVAKGSKICPSCC